MLAPFTPDEISDFERLLIATVQRWDSVSTAETFVPVLSASLAGRYPETELCIVVLLDPERRIGWRWRVWDSDEVGPDGYGTTDDFEPSRFGVIEDSAADWAEMAYNNLEEDLSTLSTTALGPEDAAGVRWVNWLRP